MLTLTEALPMRGDITIRTFDAKTRELIRTIEIRNKITLLAADVLVELLAQRSTDPAAASGMMHSMRFGTSSTAASRADTNLGAFSIGVALADVNKVTGLPGELEFTATLESGDGNGVTYQEAGLFTAGATPSVSDAPGTAAGTTRMFARQVHPPIAKTISIVVAYSWRIAFTA